MAPYEEKGKIMEFLSCLANNNIFVFIFLAIVASLLAILAWFFLPVYFSLGIFIIIAIGLAVFISYRKDISIPLIEVILKREYYRVKFKHGKKEKKSIFIRAYLKVLYYFILLFKNSEESFTTLKEETFIRLSEILDKTKEEKIDDKFKRVKQTIEKIKKGQEVDKASLTELEKELFEFSKFKQKKATVFSLTAITALIITTVVAGLISSFLFPEVFKTRAASYGFLQTSWSGGSSTATALHPGDQANWNKFFSKDNVSTSTPGELSLDFGTTAIWSQTSDEDWQTHATSSTYYLNGSVGIVKPNGVSCSAAVECSSGFCVDGYCCNNACTSTCNICNKSGSEGTCSVASADTDLHNDCTPVTCTDYIYGWSGNNCLKYSGSSAHNGMCNGAGACYTSATDSCAGAGSTSASCGSSGCLMACVAGSLATSYDSVGEICYTSDQHSCSAAFVCDGSGTCICSNGGYLTGGMCIYMSAASQSCTQRCAELGLSTTEWNDNSNCDACHYFTIATTCQGYNYGGVVPCLVNISPVTVTSSCQYRISGGVPWDANDSSSNAYRFCRCY